MNILAHALWTNLAYEVVVRRFKAKTQKKDRWTVVFFGIIPDFFAFTLPFLTSIFGDGTLGVYARNRFYYQLARGFTHHQHMALSDGSDLALLPPYVFDLYNISHSFLIFTAVFFIVWMVHKRPYWLMGGWGLHILTDVWSHSDIFFPTPLFFPLSYFHVSGISWADPRFMAGNYLALVLIYIFLYARRRNRKSFP